MALFPQEQEWRVVESLEADFAEFKGTQFQLKVHEKEIQLITEVRDTGWLPYGSRPSLEPLSLRAQWRSANMPGGAVRWTSVDCQGMGGGLQQRHGCGRPPHHRLLAKAALSERDRLLCGVMSY
jgi:hypothetical protein